MIGLTDPILEEMNRRAADNEPWWAKFISKEGLGVALAAALVYWLATSVSGDVKAARSDLRQHMQETGFYQHQLCVLMAKSAGEPSALCEVPQQSR